jgi:nucleotide-binding universal stress UspA family protein
MLALKNVLVAFDFGEASAAALRYGRSLAGQCGARLHVLHVRDNAFMRPIAGDPGEVAASIARQLQDQLSQSDRIGLDAVTAVRTADQPANEIVQYAADHQVDLIVVGTNGRKGVAHLLVPSVAERVVRTAVCPVLTVRHPEREFVVTEREVARVRTQEHPGRD